MASWVKDALGHMPAAASAYAALRPGRPRTRYNLEQLAAHLPGAIADVRDHGPSTPNGKKLILFATLHYWIEQAVMVGLALRARGHDVTVAYLPYSDWRKSTNGFDLQRQDLYTKRTLQPVEAFLRVESLLGRKSSETLVEEMEAAVAQASDYDVMYSLQSETVDRDSALFRLRMERNRSAGHAAVSLLQQARPHAALIPNGLVTELGMFYQAAHALNVPAITYEFNDQREQIWIAQDDIVMHQNTDAMWAARGSRSLSSAERDAIREFEAARSGATTFGKGTRLWQDVPRQGAESLRHQLGLDDRPIVLLATNVLGDSLTLGRHTFAGSMAEWVEKTIRHLALRQDVQVVVRVHPGERLIHGPSLAAVIEKALPAVPSHIHVIGPRETTNTYDLMDLASLGIVYTTTVGLEMAMRGVPVIVGGNTHYRGRGFTLDPTTWDEYFQILDDVLADAARYRLAPEAVEMAWNYGYRFVFEYPQDFPWRLMHFWEDFEEWPLSRLRSQEGEAQFGQTFRYLAGERIEW